MPQSLSNMYVHLVFSTKNRAPIIKDELKEELHSYIIGTVAKMGSYVYSINSHIDHIHILCSLPRTITMATLVSKIKTSSSKWAKSKGDPKFYWQDGYGAFSVSPTIVPKVVKYILDQRNHHLQKSYQNEFRLFLKEYNIEYDERYVWD